MKKTIKSPEKVDTTMEHLQEELSRRKQFEGEIRSNSKYINWVRNFVKDNRCINDFEIVYKKDELDEETYENICNISNFYFIIRSYFKKYNILPVEIKDSFKMPIYRIFYEDFYFDIYKVDYSEGYICIRRAQSKEKAIDYKDIMEDKEPEEYKERQKFIKEFYEQIMKSKEKAKELDIDMEYLKKIVKDEFKF
ncbi:MAG: hypothetical protein HFJ41_03230 [Clostridia bacterium]|nr:hypothetical protein [Clostridia bacterium]